LIRRGLLALGAGVPLLALITVLVLVFRGVILSPEAPRPGGAYVEGLVGQLGSLNPLFGEATAGSNDLDALLFEPLVRVLPTGAIQGRLASRWDVSPDGRTYSFTLRPNTH
jgi:ABC-type transport system substrate-binding protein